MTLGSYATWTDPETGENVRGTINAEYDFEREETVRYELNNIRINEWGIYAGKQTGRRKTV